MAPPPRSADEHVVHITKYVVIDGVYHPIHDTDYDPSFEVYEEYYELDDRGIPVKVIVLPEIKKPPRRLIL